MSCLPKRQAEGAPLRLLFSLIRPERADVADFCSLKAPFGVDLRLHIFSRQIQNLSKAFLSSQNFGTFIYLALYKHNGKVADWVFTLLRQQPSQGS